MRIASLVTVIGVVVLDLIFKTLAVARLPEDGGRLRFPIDFALHKNYGIAFDLPVPLWVVIPLTVLVLVILVRELLRSKHDFSRLTALSMVAAGAMGNLIDRIVYGFTVDYIILFGRSAINLEDVLILSGIVWLALQPRAGTHS
ncbi:MAG: signal peptidase II [Patescibacteria group bacterium]